VVLNRPISTILADWFLFPALALSCEAGFRLPQAKEGKKLARGRKKRNAPRNEQPNLKEFEKS
jgi:hypothetical protein